MIFAGRRQLSGKTGILLSSRIDLLISGHFVHSSSSYYEETAIGFYTKNIQHLFLESSWLGENTHVPAVVGCRQMLVLYRIRLFYITVSPQETSQGLFIYFIRRKTINISKRIFFFNCSVVINKRKKSLYKRKRQRWTCHVNDVHRWPLTSRHPMKGIKHERG